MLPDQFSEKHLDHSLKWFDKKLEEIKPIKEFHLCHGDVNKKNIILSDNNQIIIIDNEAIKHLPFPIEFFRLKFILCRDDLEMHKIFKQAYFQGLSDDMLNIIETEGQFYSAYVLLEFALYFNKKLRQTQSSSSDSTDNSYKANRQIALNNLKSIAG